MQWLRSGVRSTASRSLPNFNGQDICSSFKFRPLNFHTTLHSFSVFLCLIRVFLMIL